MASLIPVIINDTGGTPLLTLNVPVEYTVAQLLVELIESSQLDWIDHSGRTICYELIRTANQTVLAPHIVFGQLGMLRGETLVLRRSLTRHSIPPYVRQILQAENRESDEDLDYVGNRAPVAQATAPKLGEYWKEAFRFEAVQAYEKAIGGLVRQWYELALGYLIQPKRDNSFTQTSIRLRPTTIMQALEPGRAAEIEALTAEIKSLFGILLQEQLELANYDELHKLLQDDAMQGLLDTDPIWQRQLITLLTRSSYTMAGKFRYQAARDFAALAVILDPGDQLASTLEWIAQQYLSFQSMSDMEERLETARAIFQADESYGNIANDLRELVRQSRDRRPPLEPAGRPLETGPRNYAGPPQYAPAAPPAYNPAFPFYGAPPPRPSKVSFIQKYYLWVMAFLFVIAVLVLAYWILTS